MGDIRLLRNSIIHHGGIALKNVENCELLKWYKEGDEIFIDAKKFEEILEHINVMIEKLDTSYQE